MKEKNPIIRAIKEREKTLGLKLSWDDHAMRGKHYRAKDMLNLIRAAEKDIAGTGFQIGDISALSVTLVATQYFLQSTITKIVVSVSNEYSLRYVINIDDRWFASFDNEEDTLSCLGKTLYEISLKAPMDSRIFEDLGG